MKPFGRMQNSIGEIEVLTSENTEWSNEFIENLQAVLTAAHYSLGVFRRSCYCEKIQQEHTMEDCNPKAAKAAAMIRVSMKRFKTNFEACFLDAAQAGERGGE